MESNKVEPTAGDRDDAAPGDTEAAANLWKEIKTTALTDTRAVARITDALAAARRDERGKITGNDKALSEWVDEITEAYCREGEEDVPPVYDIVRNILNAGYGRGYNNALAALVKAEEVEK